MQKDSLITKFYKFYNQKMVENRIISLQFSIAFYL